SLPQRNADTSGNSLAAVIADDKSLAPTTTRANYDHRSPASQRAPGTPGTGAVLARGTVLGGIALERSPTFRRSVSAHLTALIPKAPRAHAPRAANGECRCRPRGSPRRASGRAWPR